MVSRLPVISGKRHGKRVSPELVLPIFVAFVVLFALLVSYPWIVLTTGTILYLVTLPFGYFSHRNYLRRDAADALQERTNQQGNTTPPQGHEPTPPVVARACSCVSASPRPRRTP